MPEYKKILLCACFVVFQFISVFSQTKKSNQTPEPSAPVNIFVKDSKGSPRNGELIIFEATNTKKKISGRTNAEGKLSIALPQGDEYSVKIKGMADSNRYSTLTIPVLSEGQSFTGAFGVNITYEPAVSFTLNNVHFDVGKATLRPDSYKELIELAEYMKWKPEQVIEIGGHTDDTGLEADNMRLSQQRADAVKKFLLSKGINKDRVQSKGYGPTKPVADNDTPEGKQKNRRTEVRLIN